MSFAAAALLAAATAAANGRFPRAQRLVERPGAPDQLALYGTYGLLISGDHGQRWFHVCEAATGAYFGEDPVLEFLEDGALLVRTETALVRSERSACGWPVSLGGEGGDSIFDITRDVSTPGVVLALLGAFDANTGFITKLRRSDDGGQSWSAALELPPDDISAGLSLDVAPSDPARVYISGLTSAGDGVLLRSDDGGATFTARPIPNASNAAAPYLAAVDPNDPDRIFVRTDAYREIDGLDTGDDALLYSPDGGGRWHQVFNRQAKLFGFALSPDGATLLLGLGDPVLAATAVDPDHLGLYRVSTAELYAEPEAAAFERIFSDGVTCLRWTSSALYACLSQTASGFELGRRADADFDVGEPAPFDAALRLDEVRPLACPGDTAGAACATDGVNGWPAVCQVLGADCGATPGQPEPWPTGEGGAAGSAATSDGGSAPGPGGAGASGGASTPGEDACTCRAGPLPRTGSWSLGVSTVLLPLLRRRRGKTRPSRARATNETV